MRRFVHSDYCICLPVLLSVPLCCPVEGFVVAIDRLSSFGDRIPPQNLEAEQAVLGSMLIERPAVEKAAEILKPEDFYRDAHRYIFSSNRKEDVAAMNAFLATLH